MNTPVLLRPSSSPGRPSAVESYYRWHARIYDWTRWSFLFGRDAVLDRVAAVHPAPGRILEVGCGTGRNLAKLARRFPRAQIVGVDLSDAMLAVARRTTAEFGERVSLERRAFGAVGDPDRGADVVLCSYSLSMFNPGFEAAIAAAQRDLAPGGTFALVDFHATKFPWFARWMRVNHVRMDAQLRPVLRTGFVPVVDELHTAYAGLWEYLLFIGRRDHPPAGC